MDRLEQVDKAAVARRADVSRKAAPDAAPQNHLNYEFGTFEQRLAHICALHDVEAPEFPRGEDGGPEVNDAVGAWMNMHGINLDWLLAGDPSSMLRNRVRDRAAEQKFVGTVGQLEPEVQRGFLAYIRAVVIHGIPMEEAEPAFSQVLNEFRAHTDRETA